MNQQVLRQCPLCGETVRGAFAPGPGGRPDATCPRCGSLERHRFLAVLLRSLVPFTARARLVLDVAPSSYTTRLLQEVGADRVIRMDFDPGADRRMVDIQASLTDVPLSDGSVDLIVCYHVLEHIPDDRAAMHEIARVLSARGIGLVQVPWRPGTVTDEDPEADEATRITRFGQADHVRYYGDDFETRLGEAGLDLVRMTPRGLVPTSTWRRFHILPDETVWLVRRSDGAGSEVVDLASCQVAALPPDPMVQALRQRLRQRKERIRRLQVRLAKAEGSSAGRSASPKSQAVLGRAARIGRRVVRRLRARVNR